MKSPTQKILLASLLVGTFIIANAAFAATTIGTDISTDGLLTAAGTATLGSTTLTNLTSSNTSTSTFAGGINLSGGCLSINDSCLLSGGVPGGSDGQIQFNNGGIFGGDPNFTYQNGALSLTAPQTNGALVLNSNETSGQPVISANVQVIPDSDNTYPNVFSFSASTQSSRPITQATGLQAIMNGAGNSAITNLIGMESVAEPEYQDTITNGYASYSWFYDGGTGPVTNAIGAWAGFECLGGFCGDTATYHGFHSSRPTNVTNQITQQNVAYFNENMTGIAGVGKDFAWYSEGGTNHLETGAANATGIEIERHTSQTANLFQFLDSDGSTILASFDNDAKLTVPSVKTTPITVSALPVCNSGTKGTFAYVTDSNTNTWGAITAGSGSNNVGVSCNGTNWTVFSK